MMSARTTRDREPKRLRLVESHRASERANELGARRAGSGTEGFSRAGSGTEEFSRAGSGTEEFSRAGLCMAFDALAPALADETDRPIL